MATKRAICPACGGSRKTKRDSRELLLPTRVWRCLNCSALYRVSCTHQPSLWNKEQRRRDEGRVPHPYRRRFNTYLVQIVADEQGRRRVHPAG